MIRFPNLYLIRTRINVEFINGSADGTMPLDFSMLGKIPACML